MGKDIMEIAINLQKRYNKINEIYELTKQIQESLYRNDKYALKISVRLRTNALLEIDAIDNSREELVESFPEDERALILSAMNEKTKPDELTSDALKKINSIYMQTRRALEKTIALDKIVNTKANKGNKKDTY